MTLTNTESSVADMPFDCVYGTGKRRKLIMLKLTNTVVADSYNMAGTACPNAADIEGQLYHTLSDVDCGTAIVWSTTTIIFTGQRAGVHEIGLIVNMT